MSWILSWGGRAGMCALAAAASLLAAGTSSAAYDASRYMSPQEIRPGMKGYGRTVMSGTRIDTFEFEVIGVLTNAFYAKQDVILVRCSGLNLEYSGIIGGMSGSPCYIRDASGKDRMIGAVAYGWSFSKDPICGLQPITQMLEVAEARRPDKRPRPPGSQPASAAHHGAVVLGELIARSWGKTVDPRGRFSIFNDEIERFLPVSPVDDVKTRSLQPLRVPLMVSGISHDGFGLLETLFEGTRFEPVASGGPSATAAADASGIKLEPGSVLSVPLMMGDLNMDALGTCTEVVDDRILGFGHSLDGSGWVEYPIATGMIHTVIPSIMRSNKMGVSLKVVGTLLGDESSGIFGVVGKTPPMVPVDVTIEDVRGKTEYHFQVVQDEAWTPRMVMGGIVESLYAHSQLPREHTLHHELELDIEGLGTLSAKNISSQDGGFGIITDTIVPLTAVLNSPFQPAKLKAARASIKVEAAALMAEIERASLSREVYKPGEKVDVRVRFAHYRGNPVFTEETYSLTLPNDLPDGAYALTVADATHHLAGLRQEKPHLFRAESLADTVQRLQLLMSVPDNQLHLRLTVPEGGVAIKDVELPDLPSFQTAIYRDASQPDIQPYREALVRDYDVPFVVKGSATLQIKVDRRADQ